MKLVFVSHTSCEQGGAQGCLLDLVRGIKELHPDYLVYIIFPEQGTLIDLFLPYIDGYVIIKQPWWMTVTDKPSNATPFARFVRIIKYASKTLTYLRRINPDVVITNTIASPVTALACKMGRYKHLWFIHEVPVDSGLFTFLYNERTIVKWIEKLSDRVLFVSDYAINHYKPLITNRDKICKIHVAVNVADQTEIRKEDPVLRLLLVGHFDPNKNQLEALDACKVLIDRGCAIHLFLVGGGDENYSALIRQKIDSYSMGTFVTVVDYTKEISRYYQQADALLSCSLSEALPRAVIEAQKYGLPVLATSIDANKELIQDGYNGILYERGNIASLVDAILLANNRELREKMSRNAFAFMSDRYTVNQFVSEFIGICSTV